MTLPARFEYYEIVRIQAQETDGLAEVLGREGTILGKAYDDNTKEWIYTLSIPDLKETWSVPEHCLEFTGQYSSREDFYDGSSVRVSVDPDNGDGSPVD